MPKYVQAHLTCMLKIFDYEYIYIYIYIWARARKERVMSFLLLMGLHGFFFVDMVNCKRGSNQIHLRFD